MTRLLTLQIARRIIESNEGIREEQVVEAKAAGTRSFNLKVTPGLACASPIQRRRCSEHSSPQNRPVHVCWGSASCYDIWNYSLEENGFSRMRRFCKYRTDSGHSKNPSFTHNSNVKNEKFFFQNTQNLIKKTFNIFYRKFKLFFFSDALLPKPKFIIACLRTLMLSFSRNIFS